MTEEQWRTEGDPWRLCEFARSTTSVKTRWHGSRSWPTYPAAAARMRLAEVACFRPSAGMLAFAPLRDLFRLVERHAEGVIGNDELDRAVGDLATNAATAAESARPLTRGQMAAMFALTWLFRPAVPVDRQYYFSLAEAMTLDDPGGDATLAGRQESARRWMADTIREVVGPVHNPPVVRGEWLRANERAVANIAEEIGVTGVFDMMPVLADALEDAGCDAAEMVAHCRREGGHLRECWVLAALAGAAR